MVVGLGQALAEDRHLRVYQGRNKAHKHPRPPQAASPQKGDRLLVLGRPGALNMVTAAGRDSQQYSAAVVPSDTFATRQPDPVCSRWSKATTCLDFK